MQLPYKKMIREKSFLGFIGMCDCGHKHKFSIKDFNVNSKDLMNVQFKNIYSCPVCKNQYDGMFDVPESSKWKELSPIGVLISISLIIGISYGGYKTVKSINEDFETPKQIIIDEQKQWEDEN